MLVGLIPLLPFLLGISGDGRFVFAISAAATAVAFLGVGIARGLVLNQSLVRAGLETLGIGGVTAALSYAVGLALQSLGVPEQ